MKRPVFFTPDALQDWIEAEAYYQESRPGVAARFNAAIAAAFRFIARHPFAFQQVKRRYRRAMLRRCPYAVVQVVESAHIRVLDVIHLHRDSDSMTDRARSGEMECPVSRQEQDTS